MINPTTIATPSAPRSLMPAHLRASALGTFFGGRRIAADIVATCSFGVPVPAYTKDVFPGVRAWSPPV